MESPKSNNSSVAPNSSNSSNSSTDEVGGCRDGMRKGFFFGVLFVVLIKIITDIDPQPTPPCKQTSLLDELPPILDRLGFTHHANAAHSLKTTSSSPSLATTATWTTQPITIFALKYPDLSQNPSLLFQQQCVHGLYPLRRLKSLTSTHLETILPCRYLPIATEGSVVFVRGFEITHPDLFNDGRIVVHSIILRTHHYSQFPLINSCTLESSKDVLPSPVFKNLRSWLYDTMSYSMKKFLTSGNYSLLESALSDVMNELEPLHSLTMFVWNDFEMEDDDESSYGRDIRLHILPNRMLMMSDLEKLSRLSSLTTLDRKEELIVTSAAKEGNVNSLRINYMRIKSPNLFVGERIVVHGIVMPFPKLVSGLSTSLMVHDEL